MPEEEKEEMILIYQAKGLDEPAARALAERLMANKDVALDTLVREELGIDPDELGGSVAVAAVASFVPFTLGAAVPVLPFAFFSGTAATLTSVAASAVGLFVLGAAITLLTHRGVLRAGSRQLVIGLAAAAVTFVIGRLVGVQIA